LLKLADFIDVFVKLDIFQWKKLNKLWKQNSIWLKTKIHVNQFNSIGGIQAGVKYKALSVDHLEIMKPEDIEVKKTRRQCLFIPSCSFFWYSLYSSTRMIAAGLH
jgi:imidazolonepropionase